MTVANLLSLMDDDNYYLVLMGCKSCSSCKVENACAACRGQLLQQLQPL